MSKVTNEEFERIRERGRNRIAKLAKPKDPKLQWWTTVIPDVTWGTQDVLTPVSESAKNAEASERLQKLAEPKFNFQTEAEKFHCSLFLYSFGRPSVIWHVAPGAKSASPTKRLAQLAKPKSAPEEYKENKNQFLYSCGRASPVWEVEEGAKKCEERQHSNSLATPKVPPSEFQLHREVQTEIPPAALKAKPSERVQSLASPKQRPPGPFREPTWDVTPAALNASATPRCMELARPKGVAEGFQPAREVQWSVSRAAKRAAPSLRIEELAKPIVKVSMGLLHFNPDAFMVKPTALKGVVSRRVEELAAPIQRG